jgi:Kelch motif protein
MSDGAFQPGTWVKLPSNCTRGFILTYARCAHWGVEVLYQCINWVSQTITECVSWGWEQTKKCDWWSFLFCVVWAIIVTAVCVAFGVVVIIVCAAFTIVEVIVCLLWTLVSIFFCWSTANGGSVFLLTDGTVMMQESASQHLWFLGIPLFAFGTNRWWKLTPDKTGSYVHGTWSRLADSKIGRDYYASAVLADGRLIVCGGEYSDASGSIQLDWTNTCEVYDPIENRWSSFDPPSSKDGQLWQDIGDASSALLADGTFLIGSVDDGSIAKLDPATLTWTAMSQRPLVGSSDEDSWVLMPGGTVAAPSCQNPPTTWVYEPTGDQWQEGNRLPVSIVDTEDSEIGPGLLRYDGTAFFLGANEHTAIYDPAGSPQWSNGPDLPAQDIAGTLTPIGIHDGPAAVMVNGNLLFGAGVKVREGGGTWSSPTWFFEFDGSTFHRTVDPPNSVTLTYMTRLLVLPNGDVLFCREDDDSFYAYHSDTAVPDDSFRPVIQSCPTTITADSTIEISGLQFNGLSQANGYGDDFMNATNYPLVRIVNDATGHVVYCRTHDHHTPDLNGNPQPSMGVATGAAVVTTNAYVPFEIEDGPSQLYVVANGIPSEPYPVAVEIIIY